VAGKGRACWSTCGTWTGRFAIPILGVTEYPVLSAGTAGGTGCFPPTAGLSSASSAPGDDGRMRDGGGGGASPVDDGASSVIQAPLQASPAEAVMWLPVPEGPLRQDPRFSSQEGTGLDSGWTVEETDLRDSGLSGWELGRQAKTYQSAWRTSVRSRRIIEGGQR
jgi:hypothetical protein